MKKEENEEDDEEMNIENSEVEINKITEKNNINNFRKKKKRK